jgi:homoserine dehydrogenase
MKQINVGIIGFGTVGSGTVEILFNNREKISDRVGADINVKRIADLDLKTDRGILLEPGILIHDVWKIINDPEIDIVVELIGGTEKAKEYILGAFKKGKHVVTANKALLAKHGSEIYQAAEENGASLAFEASVGGGIPVIRALREGLAANNIKTIIGILNGTSNYILTRMAQDGLPYDKAVQEAIGLGYAEDPHDLDVDGTDAAHKLAILISVAFGSPVSFESIYREGINKLTPEDIRFADEFGYCLKLLAVARDMDGMVEARVHPAMLSKDHIMANVNDVYNAIYIEGDFVGPNLYYGLGAGRKPAGSAVVSDIISLARQIKNNVKILTPPLGYARPKKGEIRIQDMDRLTAAYYFRFSAIDKPGVLSRIAGILGDNRISISSVIQKERKIGGFVPIVMLTHEASESDVMNALKLIDRLDVLTAKTMMIRVEG